MSFWKDFPKVSWYKFVWLWASKHFLAKPTSWVWITFDGPASSKKSNVLPCCWKNPCEKFEVYTSNSKFYAPKTNQQLITTRPWGWRFATKIQQTWHNPHHGPGNWIVMMSSWIMMESHLVLFENPFHHIKLLPFFQSFTWRSCFLFQDAERDESSPNFWQGLGKATLGGKEKGVWQHSCLSVIRSKGPRS